MEYIHKYNYKGSFLKSEQPQRVSLVLPVAGSSLILGHMSLIITGMVLEFPLDLNFTQVNPLLQQLRNDVRESDLHATLLQGRAAEPCMHAANQSALIDLLSTLAGLFSP